jgi:hypothetical protein
MGKSLEEVPDLNPERPGELGQGPHLHLAPGVLDRVQGLRRDPGLPGKHPRAHTLRLSELPDLPGVDVHAKNPTIVV